MSGQLSEYNNHNNSSSALLKLEIGSFNIGWFLTQKYSYCQTCCLTVSVFQRGLLENLCWIS